MAIHPKNIISAIDKNAGTITFAGVDRSEPEPIVTPEQLAAWTRQIDHDTAQMISQLEALRYQGPQVWTESNSATVHLVRRNDESKEVYWNEVAARLTTEQQRANRLADECGVLRAELDEAEKTIGRLTRELERARRGRR